MNGRSFVVVLLLLLNSIVQVHAQDLEDRVVEYTLGNGMQFLLVERPAAPVFAGYIRFLAGSVDEREGITGLAHLFEHMAFKGTPKIGTTDYSAEAGLIAQANETGLALSRELIKEERGDTSRVAELREQLAQIHERQRQFIRTNEFMNLYDRHGGAGMNASTGVDLTTYFVNLPSNKLELWMLMESERMRYPVLREFYAERDVVTEERRLRTDTSPYGKAWEQFFAAAFTAHPYQNPTVGWMSDITTVTHLEAETFYSQFYSPDNAVASIVGDIDIDETKRLIDRYFGSIPNRGTPPPVKTHEPVQEGERRVIVKFPSEPFVIMGFHKPTLPHVDDFVFDVIYAILASGRTSRLYDSLIKRQQVAVMAQAAQGLPGARYANLFVLIGIPRHPHTVADVETALAAELERLKTEPVSEHELQKVRNQIDADAIRGLDSNEGLAGQLTYIQQLAGDWRYILEQRETFKRISADDIMRVAQKYFVEDNKTVAILQDSRTKDSAVR